MTDDTPMQRDQSASERGFYPATNDEFDGDALLRVVEGYDGPTEEEQWCPNWEIPARIPVQRLQGLKKRGLLRFSPRRGWTLTTAGEMRLKALIDRGVAR